LVIIRRSLNLPPPPIMPRLSKIEASPDTKKKDQVYKLVELTGTSKSCVEDAVEKAIKRAHKTVKNLKWFQVIETRGTIDKGKVDRWQVTLKVGFNVEDK
jgi:flavin-binding protein dodecin